MENKTNDKLLINTKNYNRNISFRIFLYSEKNGELSQGNFFADKITIYQTDIVKRINISLFDKDCKLQLENFIKEYNIKRRTQTDKIYLSVVVPLGQNSGKEGVFFIDSFLTYFTKEETVDNCFLYTSVISDGSFIFQGNEKLSLESETGTIGNTEEITDKERDFITETVRKQEEPSYFPSPKEFKEVQKKNKENEKKKSSGLFGFKKKETENKKEAIQVGENEFINPKSLKIKKGSKNPKKDLENIIGLENIKEDISDMQKYLQFKKNRNERGIYTGDEAGTLHMCFMGNPGTGKTTVARIMTGILYNMGYIKENQCIEINGLDLVGGYVGQTGIITKKVVDMARGGILFIDEAYSLCGSDYGKEAISVLLKEMEDNRNDLVVIFAGYEDDINKFLNTNSGFRSRINKYFNFLDYSVLELSEIFIEFLRKMHLKIDEDALEKCIKLFHQAKNRPNFSNGRFVRNLAEQIEETHILNIADNFDLSKPVPLVYFKRLDTVTNEDIPEELLEKVMMGI